MERFQELYKLLKEKATKQEKTFVLRVHVGEGNPSLKGRDFREIAAKNVKLLVETLEQIAAKEELAPDKVIVRFGHATHASFEDLEKLSRNKLGKLGIIVEANLTSNQVTRSVKSQQEMQQVLLKFLYNDVKTILNTDAGGVMGTTLPKEYDKALEAINDFKANKIGIPDKDKKVIYYYDQLPNLEELGDTYVYKNYEHKILPQDKKQNFQIERLKQESDRYFKEEVPKITTQKEGQPN